MGFETIETRKNYYPLAEGKEDASIMKMELGR
jgi:ribosomal protein S18 acetylase RimI-like enzyme